MRSSVSANPPHTVTRYQFVRSCCCPDWSLKRRLTAIVNVTFILPFGVYRVSGSRPRLPTSVIFAMPAMLVSFAARLRTVPEDYSLSSCAASYFVGLNPAASAASLVAKQYSGTVRLYEGDPGLW